MGTFLSMETFIWCLTFAIIPAMIASSKGRSFVRWYIYGFLLFLIALVHSILIKRNAYVEQQKQEKAAIQEGTMKKCEFCAELIKLEANLCRYCGKDAPITSKKPNQSYRISSEFNEDIKQLINKKIIQVAIGDYQIQINLESDYSISVEKTIEVNINGKNYMCDAEDPKSSDILLQLNGSSIDKAELQKDNTLLLKLSDGPILRVISVDDGNESYQVHLPYETLSF